MDHDIMKLLLVILQGLLPCAKWKYWSGMASVCADAVVVCSYRRFCILGFIGVEYCVFVNGKFCKDPKLAKPEDFYNSGLNMPRNTLNRVGSTMPPVNVAQISGFNTLGISLAEILLVVEGTLSVCFVTSNPKNHHIAKFLYFSISSSSKKKKKKKNDHDQLQESVNLSLLHLDNFKNITSGCNLVACNPMKGLLLSSNPKVDSRTMAVSILDQWFWWVVFLKLSRWKEG
ncbi:Germin-like protein subfamily 1 member 7 [Hibiscus syriacus]|uniref:Germin-like protein subfamily 1 member 7 n=1 Tax=Hibiscus syriacus TaxID=106335 RepID=A0A6A3A5B3_HIBSY|nr:Germin-like protein subfamily 1 member 7 [Hibiscus syriacus]